MLAACVSSLAGVVDHIIAVDGAYMLYPHGQSASDPSQLRVIEEIARGLRIGFTAHVPAQVWAGNEVEKRNHALRLAEAVTSPDGWYFIHDGDCVVTYIAPDWFDKLDEIARDDWGTITVAVRETRPIPGYIPDPTEGYAPVRLMYRALRGMQYGPTHWTITAPDPDSPDERICFWGDSHLYPVDPYDAGHLIKVDHRKERPEYRDLSARKYYAIRDRLGIERATQVMTLRRDGKYRPLGSSG